MKMKLNELFTTGNGLFEHIFEPNYQDGYNAIFGDTSPRYLDLYTMLNYGGRAVLDTVTGDTCTDIVLSVIAINIDGWQRQAAALDAEYDILNPTKEERTETETVTVDETGDNTQAGAEKAFNDTDFSDSERTTTQDSTNRSEERNTTEKITGIGTGKSIPEEIQKELEVRRINLKKEVIFAIVNEITTSIY